MAAAPLAHFADPELWRLGAHSTRGLASAISLAGLALIGIAWRRAPGHASLAASIGAALCVLSFALSGHAATAPPRYVSVPALLVHAAVAAFWLGSLPPLLAALPKPDAGARLERFSRLAVILVPALLLAGIVLAWLQLRSLGALVATDYGLLLVLKIAIVALLLGLAAFNRLRLTPSLRSGAARARPHLRATIAAELVAGAAILAVTAVLAQTEPARSVALHPPTSVVVEARAGARVARIEATPARPGFNTLTVTLRDASSAPLEPLEVGVELSNPAAGIEPIIRPMERIGAGRFRHAGPELALPGRWTVIVRALISDFERAEFEAELDLR